MNKILLTVFLACFSFKMGVVQGNLKHKDLWEKVVTLDRIVWAEREGVKKINQQIDDESFVRRIYLDITGKIPTYEQMIVFRQSKDPNKRQDLIKELLNSPGYISHFTVFWQDLLRITSGDPKYFYFREYTRYIERFLAENRSYDKIVYDLITSQGSAQENPASGYYYRDHATGPADTFNATTRAFLGTRLGCAQCHNHRFDKWTQKEFYEASAYLHGVDYIKETGTPQMKSFKIHLDLLPNDKRFKGQITNYSRLLLTPSVARVKFTDNEPLTYPENYRYDNAKPGEIVKSKIVFDYGDEHLKGETIREQFANWLTSKNNPMFAKVMANRLWKRIMGVANMDPVDDYKDSITIQNQALFDTLGDLFVGVDYDMKAFLSIIFNSEAYQYSTDVKNNFNQDAYKAQGALVKRMSFNQLNDSLLVLRYGNLDRFSRTDPQYFEFEDKLYELTVEYKKEIFPISTAYVNANGRQANKNKPSPEMIDVMLKYHDKVRELEDYYQIEANGYLKHKSPMKPMAVSSQNKDKKKKNTMEQNGSYMHDEKNNVLRAHYVKSDFLKVFGKSDGSVTNTNLETRATMQQLLTLTNSEECKKVTEANSYVMKHAFKIKDLADRVSYLYYSIYGRAPTKSELSLASDYCKGIKDQQRWSNYTLALLNSPEFYFIK